MNAVKAAIQTTLSGGTALVSLLGGTAIYDTQAPKGTPTPYVVFSHYAGGPENVTPSDSRNYLYLVRGYSDSAKTAGSIDAAAEALLHNKTLTVTGYTNYWTVKETDLESVETPPDGIPVWMAGGLYRIRIDA